jgi:hypothetical protein
MKNLLEMNMVIVKMLLPIDSEIDNERFGGNLRFNSKILEKKFKMFASFNFLNLTRILAAAITLSLVVYMILIYSFTGTSGSLQEVVDFFILFLGPIFYVSTFTFNWSRRVETYSKFFQFILVVGSGFYSIATYKEHSMLAILVLQIISMHFNLQFLGFFSLCILNFAAFAIK